MHHSTPHIIDYRSKTMYEAINQLAAVLTTLELPHLNNRVTLEPNPDVVNGYRATVDMYLDAADYMNDRQKRSLFESIQREVTPMHADDDYPAVWAVHQAADTMRHDSPKFVLPRLTITFRVYGVPAYTEITKAFRAATNTNKEQN